MVKKLNIALKRKLAGSDEEKRNGKREKYKARKSRVIKDRLDELNEEMLLAKELADFDFS